MADLNKSRQIIGLRGFPTRPVFNSLNHAFGVITSQNRWVGLVEFQNEVIIDGNTIEDHPNTDDITYHQIAIVCASQTNIDWIARITAFTEVNVAYTEIAGGGRIAVDDSNGDIYVAFQVDCSNDAAHFVAIHDAGDLTGAGSPSITFSRLGDQSALDLPGGTNWAGSQCGFIAKYNSNGEAQWCKRFGPNSDDTDRQISPSSIIIKENTVKVMGLGRGETSADSDDAYMTYGPGEDDEYTFTSTRIDDHIHWQFEVDKDTGLYLANSARHVEQSTNDNIYRAGWEYEHVRNGDGSYYVMMFSDDDTDLYWNYSLGDQETVPALTGTGGAGNVYYLKIASDESVEWYRRPDLNCYCNNIAYSDGYMVATLRRNDTGGSADLDIETGSSKVPSGTETYSSIVQSHMLFFAYNTDGSIAWRKQINPSYTGISHLTSIWVSGINEDNNTVLFKAYHNNDINPYTLTFGPGEANEVTIDVADSVYTQVTTCCDLDTGEIRWILPFQCANSFSFYQWLYEDVIYIIVSSIGNANDVEVDPDNLTGSNQLLARGGSGGYHPAYLLTVDINTGEVQSVTQLSYSRAGDDHYWDHPGAGYY